MNKGAVGAQQAAEAGCPAGSRQRQNGRRQSGRRQAGLLNDTRSRSYGSNILSAVGSDATCRTLEIRGRRCGRKHAATSYQAEVHRGPIPPAGKGGYFNMNIRPIYDYHRTAEPWLPGPRRTRAPREESHPWPIKTPTGSNTPTSTKAPAPRDAHPGRQRHQREAASRRGAFEERHRYATGPSSPRR